MKSEPPTRGVFPSISQPTPEPVPAQDMFTIPSNMSPGSDLSLDLGEYSDRDELRPTTHTLGITRNYVPTWSPQDAFRELYQNWKDAIIATFGLTQRSFKTEMKETENEIQFLVNRTNPKQLLGYILFKRKQGSVELTNFRAQLTRHNLELGGSTKRGNNAMAGTHGEGLKVAALVLHRAKHRVRLTSRNYNWTFGFRGLNDTLYCRLSPVPDRQIRATRNHSGDLRADLGEDVCILIDKGKGGNQVSEGDFREWIKVTLDITRPKDPNNIIETPHGDLILDMNFAGKTYLKGLLLPNSGSSITRQQAGYNLFQGHTNRDRERLKSQDEEAKMLMHIWQHSIDICGDRITQRYIDLLQDHQDCVDVSRADHLILRTTAVTIWERLKSQAASRFYYDREDPYSSVSIDVIKKNLKRQPTPLSAKLWRILRKYSLVHTAQEERIHVFRNSSASDEQETVFSKSIQHGLKASLGLNPMTELVRVEYVSGAETDIDMLFDKERQLLKVHEKWLNFTRTHEKAPCRISMAHDLHLSDSTFCCDHVIEELYELAVQEITQTLTLSHVEAMEFARSMRLKVREKLQQMPRMISMKYDGSRKLVVSWTNGENDLIREALGNRFGAYCVTLHRDQTCSQQRSKYLYKSHQKGTDQSMTNGFEISLDRPDNICECRHMVVRHPSRQAVFSDLDPREKCFPMIASEEELAFFGMPPDAVQAPDELAEDKGLSQAARHNEGQGNIQPEESFLDMPSSDHESMDSSPGNAQEPTQLVNGTGQRRRSDSVGTVQTQPGVISWAPVSNSAPTTQQTPNETQLEQETEQGLLLWEKEMLELTFDAFFVSRNLEMLDLPTVMFLALPHLGGYRFIMNEYAQILLRPEIATAEEVECVVFVHRIYKQQNETDETQFYLLATRYSFLESTRPFSWTKNSAGSTNRKELLLHFTDFETMGERQDAEIIPINKIMEAKSLEHEPASNADPVQLAVDAPADIEASGFYCRLAIRSKVGNGSACITPLGSNLLRHSERWKIPQYAWIKKPMVVDFSPRTLGLAEGFSQAGCEIAAGIGFHTQHDMTWKARYLSAEVYDGVQNEVLTQITNGQVVRPSWLQPGTTKVAVIGTNHPYFQNKVETKMELWIEGHVQALKTVQQIMSYSIQGANYFDFLACFMPATALLPQILPVFMQTISSILGKRYSIHIHKTQLPQYGLFLDKAFVVILASPICAEPRWDWNIPTPYGTSLGDVIGDLSFQNPRKEHSKGPYALACKNTSSNKDSTVYNHNTGHTQVSGATQPVVLDTPEALRLPLFRAPLYLHPVRNDLLTVREMARIFGFPDDFVFYDGPRGSYHYFSQAVPPPIAAIVARGIRGTIDQFSDWDMGGLVPMEGVLPTSGGNKRPRLD